MSFKDTLFSVKRTLNCGSAVIDFKQPRVMGILNITPDSFYDGGRYMNKKDILLRTGKMLEEGADMIDVGAYSSRPGAAHISAEEEKRRLAGALEALRKVHPGIVISVDTFRADVASFAVNEFNVNIINDISSGMMDPEMIPVVASLRVPYIMMHMQGTPQNMQVNPVYQDVTKEVLSFFAERLRKAVDEGLNDIIVDPGFGFGKSLDDNYKMLRELDLFRVLGCPVMVGLSRKSMIYKFLKLTPEEALNGTTSLHTLALQNGASILRVHDVKEAIQTIRLWSQYQNAGK
ncbi:MAG: dihydropteroate synthase [Bacteroidales bacterium]|nr:dihydropteroate synthase [Bacteroidales bacterium]